MFEKIAPEEAGISSESVQKFIESLEKRGASTHSLLLMRGDKIFTEAYWSPFDKNFCHRQYSQTKSFVSIAIGLLEEEGKLSLDDKIADHFRDRITRNLPEYLENQTIRDMLMMSTTSYYGVNWLIAENKDMVDIYFNQTEITHPARTIWRYDSNGSHILSMLAEKLSGRPLLAYLKEKLFNKMGAFQNAQILKGPAGESWGESAMLCTLRDMAVFGRFLMNYGVWNGECLMNERYLREATANLVKNAPDAHYSAYHQGYGYQIWRVCGNGFAFIGMGDQLTVCYPDKDFIFACNSDNQGTSLIREKIFEMLEDMFVDAMQDVPLPENKEAEKSLNDFISNLKLRAVQGLTDTPFQTEIDGKEYICEENPMGITKFSFVFTDGKTGEFRYTNAQGDKVIPFGVNHNVFGKFPQLGYSDEVGATPTKNGFTYKDAVSLAWIEEKKLLLFVQIIDKYFGNMSATFAFKDDYAFADFTKTAEEFLEEYHGRLLAKKR